VVAELHPGRRGRPKNLRTGEAHLLDFGDHLLRVPDILPKAVVVPGEVSSYPPLTARWRVECEEYTMLRIQDDQNIARTGSFTLLGVMDALLGRRICGRSFRSTRDCITTIRTVSSTGNHLCVGPLDTPRQASLVVGRVFSILIPCNTKDDETFSRLHLMGTSHRCKHDLQLANRYGQLTVCNQEQCTLLETWQYPRGANQSPLCRGGAQFAAHSFPFRKLSGR
jgi:hypothetical protein